MKKNLDENDLGPPFRSVMLSFLIIFVFVLSVIPVSAADFSGGGGTPDDPYKISSAEDLQNLSKNVSNGNSYSGKYFQVMVPIIDLSSVCSESSGDSWTPIGSYDHKFRGNFDGGGHTISNLYINNSSSSAIYQGLFGYTLNANISNLNLINVSITGNENVGGLVGYYGLDENVHITISNCSVTGNVSGDDGYSIGGLIGYNGARNTGGITIENCYAAGDVSGKNNVGGLIGDNDAGDTSDITIKNCYAAGNVSGYDEVGGLIGRNYAINTGDITIENCYAAGDVSGNQAVSGLIGYNYPYGSSVITIENCYATGDVSGIFVTSGLVGGNSAKNYAKIYVNNSAALNQYVNCSGTDSHVGRIVGICKGISPILKYNYAWDGMTNYSQPFTENISHNQWNGSDVLNKSVWCNKTFFKDTLHWKFDDNTWAIDEEDRGTNYPLPYLKFQSRDDTLRQKVIHLIPIYKAAFDSNTGTGTMEDITFTSGESIPLTANAFTKTGHTFEGWSKTPNGAKAYDDKGVIPYSKDITLYAVWIANNTNVTLNNKSADTPTYAVNITYNTSSFNKTLTVPTYASHGFMGYNNLSSGGVQVINSELKLVPYAVNYTDGSGNWTNDTRNIELWAVWESDLSKLVNVTFDPNGGTGEKINQTVVKSLSTALMNPGFIKEGCTLLGWNNTSASGSDVNYPVNNGLINISKDTTLYAVWTSVTPPPTTSPTSSSGSSGSSSGYSSDDTSDDDSSSGSSANVNIIGTVYFDSCGGSHVDSQPDMRYGEKIRKPEDPTRDGYIFDGWYTEDDYRWDFENDTVKDKITLYAKWNSVEVQPTAAPTQSPMPVIGILAGLGAALVLRRK